MDRRLAVAALAVAATASAAEIARAERLASVAPDAQIGYGVATWLGGGGAMQAWYSGLGGTAGGYAGMRAGAEIGARLGLMGAGPAGMIIGGGLGAL